MRREPAAAAAATASGPTPAGDRLVQRCEQIAAGVPAALQH
jgi:hypothetical protein